MVAIDNNTYVHSKAVAKEDCRYMIFSEIRKMFPKSKVKTLRTFTLGGIDLEMEKLLNITYKLSGISYEFNPKTAEIASKNAPSGISVINKNIFTHKYSGEDFIWFDFMTCLRPENIGELLEWISNNPLTKDTIFAVTYTLHSRTENEGIRQLFDNEDEHEEYMQEMGYYIGTALNNEDVSVDPSVHMVVYKNKLKSLPMVQYIFRVRKNNS